VEVRLAIVVLIGSLDTKGREYAFVKNCIIEAGQTPLVIDFGVIGEPPFRPDITAADVAKTGGKLLADLRFDHEGSETRAVAMDTMISGLKIIIRDLIEQEKCDALFGLGGSGGSYVVSEVMRSLPYGIPKLLLSTMACGDVSAYVGTKDIAIMYSVTDIAGLNRISRPILRNAAFGIAGMATGSHVNYTDSKPLISVTMNGITTPGVLRVVEGLEKKGFETAVFHTNGSSKAMEELISHGQIDGVIDFCAHELTNFTLGGMFHAGPNRMEAAGKMGIPQVLIPGAIEVINFSSLDTVPEKYNHQERKLIVHNAYVCAVCANLEESIQLGQLFAGKANISTGPVAVMLPTNGLDKYQQPPDGPWIDDEKNQALFNAIKKNLRADIQVIEINEYINSHKFADAVVEKFVEMWKVYFQDKKLDE
jgi:uncharacterized protein (UPF0261 family)